MTTATAAATADTRKPAGLAAVLAVVLLYCFVHAGFRLLASGNLGEDDPLESLHVQRLLPIYAAPQPPLYDWVLWLVQRWLGTGVAGFLLIKYAALTATAGFLYTAALRILKERIWAILAVESMALIYQIAWRYHEGFTHEVGAMVAVAATLWAFEKVIAQGRARDFLLLGLIAGFGVMTEMTYWMFLATLLLAAAVQPAIRVRYADWRLGLAVAIAVLIASPYIVALAQETKPLHFVVRHSTSALVNAGKGLLDAVRGPLFYLSPLIVLLPMFIPGFLKTALGDLRAALRTDNGDAPDMERLVLTQALAGVALCILGAAVLGASGYAMHRLMPLYLPSVIWLMGVAKRSGDSPVPRRRFAAFAALIAVVALSARLANMFVLDPVCKICRWGMPYAGLAAEISARGFTGEGVVIAPSTELAGNLRRFFPNARFTSAQAPQPLEWAHPRTEKWAIVWGDEPPGAVQQFIGGALPGSAKPDVDVGRAETVSVPWHHVWRPTGYRSSTWHVLVTDHRSPGKGG